MMSPSARVDKLARRLVPARSAVASKKVRDPFWGAVIPIAIVLATAAIYTAVSTNRVPTGWEADEIGEDQFPIPLHALNENNDRTHLPRTAAAEGDGKL